MKCERGVIYLFQTTREKLGVSKQTTVNRLWIIRIPFWISRITVKISRITTRVGSIIARINRITWEQNTVLSDSVPFRLLSEINRFECIR